MGKKIKFITASDFHFEDWGQFNKDGRRITAHLRIWSQLEAICVKHNVPLLVPGDFFNNPKHLSNRLLNEVLPVIAKPKMKVFGIDGNHDQDGISTPTQTPYGYLNMLCGLSDKWVNCNFQMKRAEGLYIHGIPYLTHNIGFVEAIKKIQFRPGHKNILMIHTDLPGALDTAGREVGSAEGISAQYSKLFKRFDLVLAGHIHKPQQLASNVIMVGANLQQNRGDRNCEFGYWIIYDDLTFKFKAITDSPKFKKAEPGDGINDYDYWDINKPKKHLEENTEVRSKAKSVKGAINTYISDNSVSKTRSKLLKNIIKKAQNED